MKVGNNYITALICLLVPLAQMGIDINLPSLPYMSTYFHSSNEMLKWSITLYLFGMGISQYVYGYFTDQFGRKKPIYIGLMIFIFGTTLCIFANSVDHLLIYRFIQGCGAGSCPVITKAIAVDIFSDKRLARVATYMTTAWALTPIFAPVIGGYIQEDYCWQYNFLFLAAYALVVLVVIVVFLPETCVELSNKKSMVMSLKEIIIILKNKDFFDYVLIMTLAFSILITFSIISPFLFHAIGLSASQYGDATLFVGLSYLLGTIANRLLINYFEADTLIIMGGICIIFTAFVTLLLNNINTAIMILIPSCIIVSCIGIIYPNSMAIAMSLHKKSRGTVSAILGWFPMIGMGVYSACISKMQVFNLFPLFSLFLLLSGGIVLLCYVNKCKYYSSVSTKGL